MYDSLEEIDEEVKKCEKCKLCRNRTNTVFGTGNPNARVMFIGEGPRCRRGCTRHSFCTEKLVSS